MARLPTVPGLSVHVVVNGKRAEERDPPPEFNLNRDIDTNEIPKIHQYINCQGGQTYSIQVSLNRDFNFIKEYDTIRCTATIDGKIRLCNTTVKTRTGWSGGPDTTLRQIPRGQSQEVELFFRKLSISEEASRATVEADAKRLDTLGCIKVEIFYTKNHKPKSWCVNYNVDPVRPESSTEISSKALTLYGGGRTHATGLKYINGNKRKGRILPSCHRKTKVIGEFYLHYRSSGPRYPVKETVDGRIEIDLTHADEVDNNKAEKVSGV